MNGPMKIMRRPQVEDEEWSLEDDSKRKLLRSLQAAKGMIRQKVQAMPGTLAGTELWTRYERLEKSILAMGARGTWTQALGEFRRQFPLLAMARAKERDSEPVLAREGVQGVDGECTACARGCFGCLVCQGRRAFEDFWILMKRVREAYKGGEIDEANRMLSRAKQAIHKLEPQDQDEARTALQGAKAAIADAVREHDSFEARGHVRLGSRDTFSRDIGRMAVRDTTGSANRPEAPSQEWKVKITKASRAAFDQSMSMPPVAVRSLVETLQVELHKYRPFRDGYTLPWFERWDSSDIINSRLQQALKNAMIREGSTSPSWRIENKPIENVSVASETAKNLPSSLSECAKAVLDGQPEKCFGPCASAVFRGDLGGFWRCLPVVAKVGVGAAGAIAGYGLYRRVRG